MTGGEPATSIVVHVQPRARATEIVGWHGDAIKIRLTAPPVGGEANAELVAFIARRLGLPRDAVQITAGASGRRKRISVRGRSRPALLAAFGLEPRAAPPGR